MDGRTAMGEALTTVPRAVAAEGARVALTTCRLCGAAILLDPADDFDPVQHHRDWHESLARHYHSTFGSPVPSLAQFPESNQKQG
jgi:hypothetical protein